MDVTTTETTVEEAVWDYLLAHCEAGSGTVSNIRQEEIARALGVFVGRVIDAVRMLEAAGRLRLEHQGVGQPYRYHLRQP